MKIESIAPTIELSSETLLKAQYGGMPRAALQGRSEDAGLLISNARTGDGCAVLSELPGYMKQTELSRFTQ